MSPQQFRENFEHELNEEHILENYELFAYEGFRVFAQSLPSYQKFICSLDEKIKNDKAVSARTACVEGFNYSSFLWWETSEFHKFVHEEAEKIRNDTPHKYFDYSSHVPPPISGDRYADVFKNTYGTMQDYELHKELHQTRTTIIELERKFPHCDHVRFVAPVVHHIAARAKAESNFTKARDLSKFCQTITSVVSKCAHALDVFSLSTKSVGLGLIKGTKKVLTVEHWKEMATGALHLGLVLVKAVNQHEKNDQVAFAALFSNDSDALFKFEQQYALDVKNHVRAINQSIKKTYQKMKTMTWEQLLEKGVEVGTTLVLDAVALHALSGVVSSASNTIIEELSMALEKGTRYATEECMVEVAGFGKLLIEEGIEAAYKVSEVVKESASIIKQPGKSLVQVAREIKNIESSGMKSIGNNTWESPGGLVYKPDKKFGNRIQHVLSHVTPNSTKGTHTIFSVPENKVLELIDEAWAMKGEALAADLSAYLVEMGRIIGTKGESVIRIVVAPGTTDIITAYPVNL